MSHFKLLDKLGIEVGETKTRVNLYHHYRDDNYDTITDWWVRASAVEQKFREWITEDAALKDRSYIKEIEEENRELKRKLNKIISAIKE